MSKLLVHVPISNRAWALPQFWQGLFSQELPRAVLDSSTVIFDVNDSQDETLSMLRYYARVHCAFGAVEIREVAVPLIPPDEYKWCAGRLQRITALRNAALKRFRAGDETDLFSIDSDVILKEPDTLAHLLAQEKPVIAAVYHTRWGDPAAMALPNVWQSGRFEMSDAFRDQLLLPGHYPVGGLGACTLIARAVADAGVTYDPIYNAPASYGGLEDRAFCLRAACAGFQLWACSCKQVAHLERTDQPLRVKLPR